MTDPSYADYVIILKTLFKLKSAFLNLIHSKLPVYFIFPNLTPNKTVCNFYWNFPFTVLGMVEIILPTLSINYALRYDVASKFKLIPSYYIFNLLGIYIVFVIFIDLIKKESITKLFLKFNKHFFWVCSSTGSLSHMFQFL